jgi:hypothetical protein
MILGVWDEYIVPLSQIKYMLFSRYILVCTQCIQVHSSMYKYILVHTSMYKYILVCTMPSKIFLRKLFVMYDYWKQYSVRVTCMQWCYNTKSVPLYVSNIYDFDLLHTRYRLVFTFVLHMY